MRISAKADYAMRAALELAAAKHPPLKRDQIASAQGIPVKFLETMLGGLKHAGIVASQEVWVALRSNMRAVLERVTLADVVEHDLPAQVTALTADPEAWHPHPRSY
jgi:DNA-binding IscR family transcriptional regulator